MTKIRPSKTISSEIIIDNKYVTLKKDCFVSGDGKKGTYYFLTKPDAVMSIGMDEDRNLILVKEYRYPLKKTIINASAGMIGKNESYINAAKREFLEETGYATSDYIYLGKIPLITGKADNYIRFFFFPKCSKIQEPSGGDITEQTKAYKIPVKKVWENIQNNKIICPHTVVLLVKIMFFLKIQP